MLFDRERARRMTTVVGRRRAALGAERESDDGVGDWRGRSVDSEVSGERHEVVKVAARRARIAEMRIDLAVTRPVRVSGADRHYRGMGGGIDAVDREIEILLGGIDVLVPGKHQRVEGREVVVSPRSGLVDPVGVRVLSVQVKQNAVLKDTRVPATLIAQLHHVIVAGRLPRRRRLDDRHRGGSVYRQIASRLRMVQGGELNGLLSARRRGQHEDAIVSKPSGGAELDSIETRPALRGHPTLDSNSVGALVTKILVGCADAREAAADVVLVTVIGLAEG